MFETIQGRTDRPPSPRVRITYDVRVGNAVDQLGLPFVIGVMADLSADAAANLPALAGRKFREIDRENFNDVLRDAAPEVCLRVNNTITNDGSQLAVQLTFRDLEDFSPVGVAIQVEPLRALLGSRHELCDMLADLTAEKAKRLRELGGHLGFDPVDVESGDIEAAAMALQGEIDRRLSRQLSEIMHHEKFQAIEGTWRGLRYLVLQAETGDDLKVKVLNVSKSTLATELHSTGCLDSPTLVEKTEEVFDVTGRAEPFGLLVGDYSFSRLPADVGFLRKVCGLAAAAHAPFVAAASPQMFGLDNYKDFNRPRCEPDTFKGPEYTEWQDFRNSEDSRWVALTLPRVLARLPYGQEATPVADFHFAENVYRLDHSRYLWMSSAWAYAARCADAFARDGWLMRTTGVEGGGKVENLPAFTFLIGGGREIKCPTEVLVPDRRENELSNLGFLPLVHCKDTDFAAFLGAQSCQKPQCYFDANVNAKAQLSTKINYLMSVARFSHGLKAVFRNSCDPMEYPVEWSKVITDWIANYSNPSPELASDALRASRPLSGADVRIEPNPAKPGWFWVVAFIRPYYMLEGLNASIRFCIEMPPAAVSFRSGGNSATRRQ